MFERLKRSRGDSSESSMRPVGTTLVVPWTVEEVPQSALEALLEKPGYRLACDLDADISPRSAEAMIARASAAQLDASSVLVGYLGDIENSDTYKKTNAIIDSIHDYAPLGNSQLVWDLYNMLGTDIDYYGRIRRFCHGTTVAGYMGALASLNLTGPDGAPKRLESAADRDNYPVWYGHFNQVVGEIALITQEKMTSPSDSANARSVLSNMEIRKARATMTGKQTMHTPYDRGIVAAVVLSNVPWHSRYKEATKAANSGQPLNY